MKVLAVDDQPINRFVACKFLATLGHETVEVGSGDEAIEAVSMNGFDLILMDLRMLDTDGLAATKKIREMECLRGRKRVPIIALTAERRHLREADCLDAGMDGFLEKPLDFGELEKILQQIFRDACPH